jgi:glycosyltransferase involved in cell wall biosynthesis
MNKSLITVGLTAYNAISTIERALDSALAQSWANIEIVCVDDFSVDGTYEYLNSQALNNPSIKVYRNVQNLGVAFSRNRIIKESQGEFIAFFDDDDESLPDRITIQCNNIINYEKKYPEAKLVICHSMRNVIYPGGASTIHRTMGSKCLKNYDKAPNGKNVAKDVFIGGYVDDYGACPTCSQMARKSLYQKIGGFDNQFRRLEDTDFIVRLALAGGHFIGTREALVSQYMTNSADKSIKNELFFSRLLIKKHKSFLLKQGQYYNCLYWTSFRHQILAKDFRSAIMTGALIFFKAPLFFAKKVFSSIKNISININFSNFHVIKGFQK